MAVAENPFIIGILSAMVAIVKFEQEIINNNY